MIVVSVCLCFFDNFAKHFFFRSKFHAAPYSKDDRTDYSHCTWLHNDRYYHAVI